MHRDHQKYLGICVPDEEGNPVYYVWVVLVLGLRDAAHLFTRLIKPIMGRLRKDGFRGQIYIDDLLTAGASKVEALESEEKAYALFSQCGYIFKPSKRSGEPAQECRFLGLLVNSVDMVFKIPEDKIKKMLVMMSQLAARQRLRVKAVARLLGTLQSVRLATGPLVQVMTRSLYHVVKKAKSWKSWVVLTELAKFELDWWRRNLEQLSGYPIPQGKSTTVFSYEVASDASEVGNFAYLLGTNKEVLAGRPFNQEEMKRSSTWRELSTFEDTWTNEMNLRRFQGATIAHYTDSQAMARIISKGSRNPELQPMVMRAVLALRRFHIEVEAVWRSREEGIIKWADVGSREFYKDDVELDFGTMSLIYRVFGDFDVDTFACRRTSKGRAFFSLRDSPYAAGVDFFHQELKQEVAYFCFPPTKLLRAAVMHFKCYKVTAVMVVPVWPTSSFFSVFWPDGVHAAGWVSKVLLVQPEFICSPRVTDSVLRGTRQFFTAVIRVDFRSSEIVREGRWRDFCLEGGCRDCAVGKRKRE